MIRSRRQQGCGAGLAVVAVFSVLIAALPPSVGAYGIPEADWAQEHWLPFEEPVLYRALRIDRAGLLRAIWDADPARGVEERHLAHVARARGVGARALERRLLRRWRGTVTPRQYRRLARRTRMLLRDSHLGTHMLGHTFHHRSLNRALPGLLGLGSLNELNDHRNHGGSSLAEIAVAHGRSVISLRHDALGVLRRQYRRGVRLKATPGSQLELRMTYSEAEIDDWLSWSRSHRPSAASRRP
jgi:hypothetical protein